MSLILPLVSLLSLPAAAQDRSEPNWRLFQRGDGLLSNDLWSVLVTDEAVWIGTDQGIARFDGAWTNYPNRANRTPEDVTDSALPDGWVVELTKSAEGGIWAATKTGHVAHWNGRQWRLLFSVPGPIYQLREYSGLLYAATENGLIVYDPEKGETKPVAEVGELPALSMLASPQGLWVGTESHIRHLDQNGWHTLRLPAALGALDVTALAMDERGKLWFGTPYGVAWYDPRRDKWADQLIPVQSEQGESMPVFSLASDNLSIWAASEGGGARQLIENGSIVLDMGRTGQGRLTTPLVREIATGLDGTVWFATAVGLFQYQQQRWINDFVVGDGVDQAVNTVNELLISHDGSIWVATGAGVRHKVQSKLGYHERFFSFASGDLPSRSVNTLAEDAEYGIWSGTFQGVARYDGAGWQVPVAVDDLPSPVVTDLLATGDGMWLGTEEGLALYDLESKTVIVIPAMAGFSIEALAYSGDGRLWVGTADDGLWIRQADGDWVRLSEHGEGGAPPVAGVMTAGLARDPITASGMWANVRDVGLVHFEGARWEAVDTQDKLPSRLFYRLFTDPVNGSLWIGGEGGVTRFDGVTWGTFTTEDGLQSTAIYAIAYEPDGAYWFGGPEGLTRYEPDHSTPWIKTSIADGVEQTDDGRWTVQVGRPLELNFEAGDLHTAAKTLKTFYRRRGDAVWQEIDESLLTVQFDELGDAALELMSRDQAFNYSSVAERTFSVLPVPELIRLPVLGEVERSIFWTLLLLGGTALLGFGYVSLEIVRSRWQAIAAVNRGFNPYVSGEPIRREELFFARQDLLQRIVDTLHNNSIMIHGERRIGKTTLLYQLGNVLREIDDPDYRFVPVYIDLEGTAENHFFHYLMEEIATGVQHNNDIGAGLAPVVASLHFQTVAHDMYTDRDFNQDLRRLIAALQEQIDKTDRGRTLRLILLMDEMDVMSRYDHLIQQQLRRIFMRDFSATLGAVVAGIQISKDWDRVESPWFNLFNEIALQPFTREQALELLIEPVRDVYRYDADALDFIIAHSDGRPFRIQQYGLEAVNHMLAARRRRITLEDVEDAHRHVESSYGEPPAMSPAAGRSVADEASVVVQES